MVCCNVPVSGLPVAAGAIKPTTARRGQFRGLVGREPPDPSTASHRQTTHIGPPQGHPSTFLACSLGGHIACGLTPMRTRCAPAAPEIKKRERAVREKLNHTVVTPTPRATGPATTLPPTPRPTTGPPTTTPPTSSPRRSHTHRL